MACTEKSLDFQNAREIGVKGAQADLAIDARPSSARTSNSMPGGVALARLVGNISGAWQLRTPEKQLGGIS
jgi:polysaccharide deacetylase 2 family uncharacterized protein YibQ